MDFSNAVAHGGLSAKGTATGQGVKWTPRVGTAATRVNLADADLGASFTATFPEASAMMLLGIGAALESGNTTPAADTLVVTGVTGTSQALVNGTYTRSATLYNYAPQWINGNAVIRLSADGLWAIALSGVMKVQAAVEVLAPTFSGADYVADGGDVTGTPVVEIGAEGDVPVVSVDMDRVLDPEAQALPAIASRRGLEVVVTSGSGLLSFSSAGIGVLPLPTSGRFLLVLPAATPAGLVPYLNFFASEPGTVMQATVVAVAA